MRALLHGLTLKQPLACAACFTVSVADQKAPAGGVALVTVRSVKAKPATSLPAPSRSGFAPLL